MAQVFRSLYLQNHSYSCEYCGPFFTGSFQWYYIYRHANFINSQYCLCYTSRSHWHEWNYSGWNTDYAVNRLVREPTWNMISIDFCSTGISSLVFIVPVGKSCRSCWSLLLVLILSSVVAWLAHFPLFFFHVCFPKLPHTAHSDCSFPNHLLSHYKCWCEAGYIFWY